MPERYTYKYVTDISLSVYYICSTNIDLSVIFASEIFSTLQKHLFFTGHTMCYVHISHSNTNSWLHTHNHYK
jgi:hypothetical protein